MPSIPVKSSVLSFFTIAEVLFPPTPRTTGTLPAMRSTVKRTTSFFSSSESVGVSPVVPNTTI